VWGNVEEMVGGRTTVELLCLEGSLVRGDVDPHRMHVRVARSVEPFVGRNVGSDVVCCETLEKGKVYSKRTHSIVREYIL